MIKRRGISRKDAKHAKIRKEFSLRFSINCEARPLWGVADTGPWLHDGRATSLLDAIMLHGNSVTGSGSEAAPIIDAFEKLAPADQQAVVNFLLSLRLPVEQN